MTAHIVSIHLIRNMAYLIGCFSSLPFCFLESRNSSVNWFFSMIPYVSNRLGSSRMSHQCTCKPEVQMPLGSGEPGLIHQLEAFDSSQGNLNVSSQSWQPILTLPVCRSCGTAYPISLFTSGEVVKTHSADLGSLSTMPRCGQLNWPLLGLARPHCAENIHAWTCWNTKKLLVKLINPFQFTETKYRSSSKVYIKNSRYDTANIKMYMLSKQDKSFDWNRLWW